MRQQRRGSVPSGSLFPFLCDGCAADRTGGKRPCRRMSSQQSAAGGTEERTVQQENELQALASIFGDDFRDLRSKDPWKVTLARRVWLMLHPDEKLASATCRTFTTPPPSPAVRLCFQVKRPPEVHLCLRPNGLNNGGECYVTVDLQVKCPAAYPDV